LDLRRQLIERRKHAAENRVHTGGSNKGRTAQFLRTHYGDSLAVEMEGRGFLEGVHVNAQVQGGVIRWIFDLLKYKTKTDTAGWQERATAAASAAAFEMLATLYADDSPSQQADFISGDRVHRRARHYRTSCCVHVAWSRRQRIASLTTRRDRAAAF
jgi:hypothetical protein